MAEISSWSVGDFKALSRANLQLPPLTILAGANSSGKSSILQSLLLLSQSVSRGGPVVLNGPLVRLGLAADVVRNGQKTMQLAFVTQVEGGGPGKQRRSNIHVTLSLAPTKDDSTLSLRSLEVKDSDGAIAFAATSTRMNTADVAHVSKFMQGDVDCLRVTHVAGRRAPSRMYLMTVGLLPLWLVTHRDSGAIEKQVFAALSSYVDSERLPHEFFQELNQLVDRDHFLKSIGRNPSPHDASKQGVKRGLPITRWGTRDLATMNPDEFVRLMHKVAEARAKNEWVVSSPSIYRFFPGAVRPRRLVSEGVLEDLVAGEFEVELLFLSSISSALQEFGSSIQYLGPLRDEPRVVHGAWDERFESLPVGLRGELTAEVLTRRKNHRTTYRDWNNERKTGTLPEAVSAWCEYLGIGDHIEVLDLGKLGRGVELQVNGVPRDLTTIGVGASQLLPVLVGALSAPSRSIFLVEQPELHLHPKVQSRLADFFLFARPDVKFIVETHSEYLITRMRRRIAEDKARPRSVQVLFAEQFEGATSVRSLQLSELGDFDSWPKGFFDAQDDDAVEILRAISRRLADKS